MHDTLRHCRACLNPDRRLARLRTEAAPRDGPLARTRHARVQGVGHGTGRPARAASALDRRGPAAAFVFLVLEPWACSRGAFATARKPRSSSTSANYARG